MQKSLFLVIGLVVLSAVMIRVITKLPARYERKPKTLSTWSALDHGIDPTDREVL